MVWCSVVWCGVGIGGAHVGGGVLTSARYNIDISHMMSSSATAHHEVVVEEKGDGEAGGLGTL